MQSKRVICILLCLACLLLAILSHQSSRTANPYGIPLYDYYSQSTAYVPPVACANYAEYADFFEEPLSEVADYDMTEELRAYREDVRTGKRPIIVPYWNGVPIVLDTSPIYQGYSIKIYNNGNQLFPNINFTTNYNEKVIHVKISILPDEYSAWTDKLSWSELASAMIPHKVNVHNYRGRGYSVVEEQPFIIGGNNISVLYLQAEHNEYFEFLMDGYYVTIFANTGVITQEFLANFNLGVLAEEFA